MPATIVELAQIIADEGLSVEWDGPRFEPQHRTEGDVLSLCAHEVAWGRFEQLEAWCVEKKVPFARWSGACGGQWGAERVVFTGEGEPKSYAATEDDTIMISQDTAEKLGSFEAIIAHFDAGDFNPPPLTIKGELVARSAE